MPRIAGSRSWSSASSGKGRRPTTILRRCWEHTAWIGDVLRFEPRFPLEPGVRYRAEFDPADGSIANGEPNDKTTRANRRVLASQAAVKPSATVTAVYPSRSTLPENLLRFYIHFSAPMSRRRSLPAHPAARRGRQAGRGPVPGARRGALVERRQAVHAALRPRPDQARPQAARGGRARPGGRQVVRAGRRPRLARRGWQSAQGRIPQDVPHRARR